MAEAFARSPGIVGALAGEDPSAVLQPRAEAVRKATGVDSVSVFDASDVQLTSPDPEYVGKPYEAPEEVRRVVPQIRAGRTVTFRFEEPGYQSITTAVPVLAPDGRYVGVVSVAITVQRVNALVRESLPVLLGGAAGAVALTTAGTALVARRLLRQTRGLGPADVTRLYEHHDAVLHAVREGVLILDGDGRLVLANDEARRLLDLPAAAEHRHVSELGLDADTERLLMGEDEVTDRVHRAGDRLLAVNKRPTDPFGGPPGSVVTLRDSTELHELAGRVEVAGQRRQILYEAGTRVGRTLDVTRTCEELAEVAVPRFADVVTVDLFEAVAEGEAPEGADRRMRRTAQRGAQAGEMPVQVGEAVTFAPASPQTLSTDSGHAVRSRHPPQAAAGPGAGGTPAGHPFHSAISVPLRAHGMTLGLVEFLRREGKAPYEDDDLSLAEELATHAAVSVDNARRYAREHGMAETLQRSLLPSTLPEQTTIEVASRYLPAHAGVGGDWFDVITLPGFRTALVVGDVVGHGIPAAVAMGRLRTAVHNFTALDLPPEEVLGRLDELVERLDREAKAGAEISGSTCLYAVYEPVTGVCTVARAGHPGPALVSPDGDVQYPEVPASPPLGVGGHPFETAELRLAAGSRLVLFTDGLVEDRTRDLGRGLEDLRSALAEHRPRGPDEICQAVTDALLGPHPADDAALLVARTRLLRPEQVADWDVPMDPAAVGTVRAACGRRLEEWGLEEIAFATELILSELITNAIRYGSPPVKVRLLYDSSLICEVSDGSSTAPHLRWAESTDEGGRGIFLVAQLAHRWGTRYPPGGKVIWAEQLIPEGTAAPGKN
ncbi:SpoIIE family protein phosphatase [Streptomyces sp. NPDC058525]|uniref:SpoIIE family protein phosphatase n=1 Tax=Streptomyces sp. NPDC058525 TaxID=3346538 RepID=UPI00365D146A